MIALTCIMVPRIRSKLVSAIAASRPDLRTFSTRRSKVCNLSICRAAISPFHKISHFADLILADTSHVLRSHVHHRYEAVIKGRYDVVQEGLWLMFTSNTMHRKKIVRSWAKRRVTQAVVQELKARGYDEKGRKLDFGAVLEDQGGKGGDRCPDVLIGTVDVAVLNHSVDMSFVEVQKQAGGLVEEILNICGRQAHTTKKSRRQR